MSMVCLFVCDILIHKASSAHTYFQCLSLNIEKVYCTLSSGVLTLFAPSKDGNSTKRAIGLYGSAIGLADSLISGNKYCFRVIDGMNEPAILQADSLDSQMDWATTIAISISMESGGGVLLENEKRSQESNGFPVNGTPSPQPIFRDFESSFVFAKSLEERSGQDIRLDPITEKIDELDITNNSFESLHPVDLSSAMEEYARKFFVAQPTPIQSLRDDELEWISIERVLNSSSTDEVFGKANDVDLCSLLKIMSGRKSN